MNQEGGQRQFGKNDSMTTPRCCPFQQYDHSADRGIARLIPRDRTKLTGANDDFSAHFGAAPRLLSGEKVALWVMRVIENLPAAISPQKAGHRSCSSAVTVTVLLRYCLD
jgi:hypothetical protein